MRGVIAVLLLGALAGSAQQVGRNAPPKDAQTPSISVSTQLVVETVVVKDKKGNSLEGLTAQDFTVTEDGMPQAIDVGRSHRHPQIFRRRRRSAAGFHG